MKRFLNPTLMVVLMCSLSVALNAQDIFKVGDVEAGPGQKMSGFIMVPKGADGPEIKL
ncbi:MAG: hypothetical protein GQ544_00080, partial [Candidatus Aminicenantes bacterium]|nr:hypothetical protein [Candidatus Aminicenantes bacterium]